MRQPPATLSGFPQTERVEAMLQRRQSQQLRPRLLSQVERPMVSRLFRVTLKFVSSASDYGASWKCKVLYVLIG